MSLIGTVQYVMYLLQFMQVVHLHYWDGQVPRCSSKQVNPEEHKPRHSLPGKKGMQDRATESTQ